MKQEMISPSWTLQVDHVERYAFMDGVFSPEECAKIIEIGKSHEMYPATIASQNKDQFINETKIRDSEVVFLTPGIEMEFVYRRLTDAVTYLNDNFFKFDLFGFNEALQFTEYRAPGGKYDYHVDKMHLGVIRKLSIVVQLTDGETYEGGDFEIMDSSSPQQLSRKQGTLLAFPSYSLHRVTPVTKGTRNSLVGWITGKPFK